MLKRFEKGKLIPGIYIIRLADDPDQLEIIKSEYLKQKMLFNENKLIVGFAKSYDEAMDFVLDTTNKAIEVFGEPLIKEYLNK